MTTHPPIFLSPEEAISAKAMDAAVNRLFPACMAVDAPGETHEDLVKLAKYFLAALAVEQNPEAIFSHLSGKEDILKQFIDCAKQKMLVEVLIDGEKTPVTVRLIDDEGRTSPRVRQLLAISLLRHEELAKYVEAAQRTVVSNRATRFFDPYITEHVRDRLYEPAMRFIAALSVEENPEALTSHFIGADHVPVRRKMVEDFIATAHGLGLVDADGRMDPEIREMLHTHVTNTTDLVEHLDSIVSMQEKRQRSLANKEIKSDLKSRVEDFIGCFSEDIESQARAINYLAVLAITGDGLAFQEHGASNLPPLKKQAMIDELNEQAHSCGLVDHELQMHQVVRRHLHKLLDEHMGDVCADMLSQVKEQIIAKEEIETFASADMEGIRKRVTDAIIGGDIAALRKVAAEMKERGLQFGYEDLLLAVRNTPSEHRNISRKMIFEIMFDCGVLDPGKAIEALYTDRSYDNIPLPIKQEVLGLISALSPREAMSTTLS